MLQFIRERAQGWIAWVIVILIGIPFVLWGVQDYLQPDPNVAVAEVNGQEIGLQEFTIAFQRTRARLRGVELDEEAEEALRRDTLEQLVRDEVMVQAAARQGLRISDGQLALAIQGQAAFQQEGAFSQLQYESFLANQGFSPGSFEHQYRRTLLVDQMFSAVSDTAFSTDAEARRFALRELEQRTFSVLRLEAARFADQALDDAQVQAYYEDNRADFRSPETVKVSYLVLSQRELARGIEVEDSVLRSLYEARRESYATPEQRHVRHILVQVDEDAAEEAVNAARDKIETARGRITAGEAFADVAREVSDDPGSAEDGGDLGTFGRGAMTPAFEEAAFGLPVGVVSEPVRTPFGFHLLEVLEAVGGGTASFEQARADVLAEYQTAEAEKLYYELAERLHNLAFEQPDNLDVAAEELGLTLLRSDAFDRGGIAGDPVLGEPAVVRAAFSEDVLAGNNSEPIELDGGLLTVLRVTDHTPAADQPLEAVRSEVEAALQASLAAERTAELGRELVLGLRAGSLDATAAAGQARAEWQRVEGQTRRGQDVDPAVLELAFGMPLPETEGQQTVDGAKVGGDFVVVALDSHKVADEAPEAMTNLVSASLQRESGQSEFRALLDTVRERAEVRLHDNRL